MADLTTLFTTQFTANVELLLQQKGSKLRGKVREGFHVGKLASPVNQIGSISMQAPAGRFAPIGRVDSSDVRRWVTPIDRELPQLIDTFDELKTIVDVKSPYAENAAYACGRFYDDTILAAMAGTAQIGTDNASLSNETFNTTNFQVAADFGASAAVGLTVAKMIEARRILRHYENDLESDALTWVVGSKQEADMLNQIEFVSQEYGDRPVLQDGRVTRFLGGDVVVTERVPQTTADTTRGVFAFVKSGMYLGVWKDMNSRADQRTDLSGIPWQLYLNASVGATRLQPGKVIRILCADTSGAPINP